MYEEDTIVAIATPLGEGAISIVRLSGKDALRVASKVCRTKIPLEKAESHTVHYGHVIDTSTNEMLDEVLVSLFRAPKTFTREDVVEINCHGGIVVTNALLDLLVREGARLAEPGEFTKRAFLNGRIDLSQAEAVMDLIRSKTDEAAKNALGQLDGGLSTKIRSLRQELLEVLAQVEVTIDYPEYEDVEEITYHLMEEKVNHVKRIIETLLQSSRHGKILREGVATAIIGRPNVGKSSLLNYLVQEDKAIVTEIAGTTRDVIEEYVNVRGIPLRLIDTAGIRETEDVVEKIGVERSRKALETADLVLLVLNQNDVLTKEDCELLEATSDKERIIVVNKSELTHKFEVSDLPANEKIIEVSVTTEQGLDTLEIAIEALFTDGSIASEDVTYLSNSRHIALFEQADKALDDILVGIQGGMPIDILQIDLTRSWELLGEIVGDAVPDELITELFSQFCLGK